MKKKLFVSLSIILVTGILLGFLQALLVPKYTQYALREGGLIGEYYRETTDHDVLFVGDCEVYEAFTPPTLWEDYGITSYIRGSAQQLIWQSYYLLEETFERESPRVVVYNVLAMKYDEPQNEAYNRMTLDGMQWSPSKLAAINASMTEEEDLLSYVFPILRYHSRWSELSGEDFQYLFGRPTLSHNGYLMQTGVEPVSGEEDRIPSNFDGIDDVCFEYLEKMRLLCEENGAELILIKAPTNHVKYYWYDDWDAQVVEYADEKGLDYYNFIPLAEEIGIDWTTDTYDRGMHLNVFGAEKLTRYFGRILKDTYQIPDHRTDATLASVWEGKVAAYYKERNKT